MNPLTLIPIIMRLIALRPQIEAAIKSGKSIVDLIGSPEIRDILKQIGLDLFPGVNPDKAVDAGAEITFGVNTTEWVQEALNRLGQQPPLVVDGAYGRATKAAVEAFQRKCGGLVVDGWAGTNTRGALSAALKARG